MFNAVIHDVASLDTALRALPSRPWALGRDGGQAGSEVESQKVRGSDGSTGRELTFQRVGGDHLLVELNEAC